MGSHGGGGTSIYIKYANKGEDICIGVFRDLKISVGVCSGNGV
jgi:hypothetical protein